MTVLVVLLCLVLLSLRELCAERGVQVNETLEGVPMMPISSCPSNDALLRPENIHIIISATSNRVEKAMQYSQTIQFYAMLHGYNFKVIDPTDIISNHIPEYKTLFKMMPTAVLSLKSLIALCKFHFLTTKFPPFLIPLCYLIRSRRSPEAVVSHVWV